MRSAAAVQRLVSTLPQDKSLHLDLPIIPDLALDGACDQLFQSNSIHYVIHVAGRFKFEGVDVESIIADNYGT